MSSASRDEGGRSRRRRRRGPSAAANQQSDRPPPSPTSTSTNPPLRNNQIKSNSGSNHHARRSNRSPASINQHSNYDPPRRDSPSGSSISAAVSSSTHPPSTHETHSSPSVMNRPSNPNQISSTSQKEQIRSNAKQRCQTNHVGSQPSQKDQQVEKALEEKQREEREREKQEREGKERVDKERAEQERAELELAELQRAEQQQRRKTMLDQIAKRKRERDLNIDYVHLRPGDDAPEQRLSDSELRQLDSSLKKCNGFLRKIRTAGVTEESVPVLLAEAESLNLSRYISEVVSAVADGKLRTADIDHILALAGPLHRRYEDFTPQLLSSLSSIVLSPVSAKDAATRKAAIRLLVEMYTIAMYADVNHVTNVLRQLIRSARESKEENLTTLGVIASFVRASSGTLLTKRVAEQRALLDFESETELTEELAWQTDVTPPATKVNIISALQSYLELDVERLIKETLQEGEKACENVTRSLQLRDSPEETLTTSFENAKQAYEKSLNAANIIADAVERPLYTKQVLDPHAGTVTESANGGEIPSVFVSNPFNQLAKARMNNQDPDYILNADHPFESDEQRMFYTELISVSKSRNDDTVKKPRPEPPKAKDANGKLVSSTNKGDEKTRSQKIADTKKRASEKSLTLDRLLSRLSTIETKEAADVFVQNFVSSRDVTRNGTKRLAKALISVSAQKLNVLAAYSRISASLQPVCGDIGSTVANHLEDDFRHFVARADIDEKSLAVCVKTSLYIGEYVKFGLISTSTLFDLIALCMKDFSGHRVDVVCHLLEACGRHLYRTPSTHLRMATILDTIWRVKSVKNLEARHNTLIETAFYAVRLSPAGKAQKIKLRDPLHDYIRHLIYFRLDSTNISWTKNQLLKLPWDENVERYVLKKIVKISRARYSTIPYVAAVVAALQKHKPMLCVGVIDTLLESIRSGMERNDGRESQKRIAEVCLLGHLMRTGVIDTKVIFHTLYLIITLGHEHAEHNHSQTKKGEVPLNIFDTKEENSLSKHSQVHFAPAPDPPGDFFRIRLTCVLLEVCGAVLSSGYQRKLEVFWVYFDRYLFCKTFQAGLGDRIPLHIDHLLDDVLESMWHRPKRVGKEGRSGMRDAFSRPLSIRCNDGDRGWHSTSNRTIKRSHTLEDALRAVMTVERSPTDLALIAIPIRSVSNLMESSPDGRLTQPLASPTGKVRSTIVGNVKDGFRTTSVPVSSAPVVHSTGQDEELGDDSGTDSGETISSSRTDDSVEDEDELSAEDDLCDSSNMSDADIDIEDEDDEDEDEDEDADEDDDEDEDDDDEDIILDMQRPKTEEEEAFARELEAMTAAAVQDARATSSRATKLDRMAIPMSLMSKKLEEERAAAASLAASAIDEDDSGEDDIGLRKRKRRVEQHKSVEFKVLFRKGGKSQLQDLKVPATSSLAVAAKESETADAARHEETRRLVLESSIVQNEEQDDFEDEVPLRVQQHFRTKEESIRQQRSNDEMELLATLARPRNRR